MSDEINPQVEAEKSLDSNFGLTRTDLTPQQKMAIKSYKQVLEYLGLDVLVDVQKPVLSPSRLTDSNYLELTPDQLMYYIGVLCGIRPYLCEELTDAKAKAIYSTVWKKFNEVGFRISFRKDRLREEIEKIEKKIEEKALNSQDKDKAKKTAGLTAKKHYTEDNLKDESSWRTYTWAKLEGEKIRKAELMSQYLISVDGLIVALKERVRFKAAEKFQAKYGDQANSVLMP
jgi:hypothetical protein